MHTEHVSSCYFPLHHPYCINPQENCKLLCVCTVCLHQQRPTQSRLLDMSIEVVFYCLLHTIPYTIVPVHVTFRLYITHSHMYGHCFLLLSNLTMHSVFMQPNAAAVTGQKGN